MRHRSWGAWEPGDVVGWCKLAEPSTTTKNGMGGYGLGRTRLSWGNSRVSGCHSRPSICPCRRYRFYHEKRYDGNGLYKHHICSQETIRTLCTTNWLNGDQTKVIPRSRIQRVRYVQQDPPRLRMTSSGPDVAPREEAEGTRRIESFLK